MGEVVALRRPELIRAHDPRELGKMVTWCCMDDRHLLSQEGLVDGLNRQIGGGTHGLAQDGLIMRRLTNQNAEIRPVQIFGKIIAKTLRADRINLALHEDCAAEGFAKKIAQTIVDQSGETFAQAQRVLPGLDKHDFNRVRTEYAHLLNHGAYQDPETVANDYRSGKDSVPRLALVPMDHVAEDILINNGRRVAFDSRAAANSGPGELMTPAYHVSFGDLDELHGPISDIFPGSLDDLQMVTAVRHGAIALNLPRPSEQPLGIWTVGELAA